MRRPRRARCARATPFIAPGATLGVIGGGQLGRMFVHAAQRMGYCTAVLDPDPDSPAGLVAHHHIHADYLDAARPRRSWRSAAPRSRPSSRTCRRRRWRRWPRTRPVAPAAAAVAICQDRAAEKAHFVRCGVPCAPHAVIASAPSSSPRVADALLPGILKTARLGYDGKGQRAVADRAELAAAWDALGGVPCVLEQLLPLAAELSVIVARGARRRSRAPAGAAEPAPRRHPRRHRRCRRPTCRRRAAQQRRSTPRARIAAGAATTSACCASSSSCSPTARWSPTRWRRARTTPATTASTPATSRSSSCRCARWPALPLVAPRLHSPAVMLNLLGDLWFADGGARVEPDWARRAGAARRAPAPVRQGRGAPRPQDGPPDRHRARAPRRARRGARAAGRARCSASPRSA